MSDSKFNIHKAKTHFSQLVAKAERGEPVVICRNDRPVAKLVPIEEEAAPIEFGAARGLFVFDKAHFDSADDEIAKLFDAEGS